MLLVSAPSAWGHAAFVESEPEAGTRLAIDRRTHRILRERMIAAGHFMTRRYFAFNEPLSIRKPRR